MADNRTCHRTAGATQICVVFVLIAALLAPSPCFAQTGVTVTLALSGNLSASSATQSPPRPSATSAAVVTPAATAACQASTLSGFTSSVDLSDSGLLLHWTAATGTTVDFALEAKSTSGAAGGWFAVAWSSGGGMAPSDAVIANVATSSGVATYAIADYSNVAVTTRFAVTGASVASASGGKIARFTRSTTDGLVKVNAAGSNKLVWAYSQSGASQTVSKNNAHRGTKTVDLSCNGANPGPGTGTGGTGAGTCTGNTGISGTACPASTLCGYSYQEQISSGILLHWKPSSSSQLDIAVELKTSSGASNGWFGLGWSNGGMAPSDTIIGNRAGGLTTTYHITGFQMSSLQGSSINIGSNAGTVTSATGSKVIQFSRTANTGAVPVWMSGVNRLIWAHSNSNSKTLAFHGGSDGYLSVDFACATAPSSGGGGGDGEGDDDTEGGEGGDGGEGGGGGGGGSGGGLFSQFIAWLGSLFHSRK